MGSIGETKACWQGESENKYTIRCYFQFIQLTLHIHILGCIDLRVEMEDTHTHITVTLFHGIRRDNKVTLYVLRGSG